MFSATTVGTSPMNSKCPCEALLEWVEGTDLELGKAGVYELPEYLKNKTEQATVDALRTKDNCYCVLLKTSIGWKGNFEGILCCNRLLHPDEVVIKQTKRPYISIHGFYPFEELYLRKDHNNGRYDVYFDLY